VTVVLGGAYIFRREETPILTETVVEEDTPRAVAAASAEVDGGVDGFAVAASDGGIPEEGAPVDDASLNAGLFQRMQELAAERAKAAEEGSDEDDDASPPGSDSTDSWGVGNTAVLEPPRPDAPKKEPRESVLEGEPAVDFPDGFPLVDGDWSEQETQPAAASDEQIAMLQRMFGSAE